MTKLLGAMVVASFALLGAAMAQGTCESQSVDKNGKALTTPRRKAFWRSASGKRKLAL